jgi:putative nucleotidyltransferase with HDIG domain
MRSEREKVHSKNVSELCVKIATQLQLPSEDIRRMEDAGYYHDIGKIVLDDEILSKIGELNEEEKIEMKRHTIVGYRILGLFDHTLDIAKGSLDHHEHWDGTGYPKGLKGEEISLLGRIIAVAEAYDFRRNPLSNAKMSKTDTIIEIKDNASIKFDPDIVEAFLQVVDTD